MYKTRLDLLSSKLLSAVGLVILIFSSFITSDIGVVRAQELETAMPATTVSIETVTPVVDTTTSEPSTMTSITSTSEVLPLPVGSATPIVEATQTAIPEISITPTETATPSEFPADQVRIQSLASDGSSFYYYADGNRIQLTPSLNWVSMKFTSDDQTEQSTALQNYGAMVGPLEQARKIPNPKLTLLPLRGGVSIQTLVQGITSLRANTASFLQVNPVFQTKDAEMAITNEFIATFPAGKSMAEIDAINSSYDVKIVEPILGQGNTFVLQISPSAKVNSISMANLYQESGAAINAAPNFVRIIKTSPSENQIKQAIAPMTVPNDEWFYDQWYLDNTQQYGIGMTLDADIDAPEAWDHTTGSSAVIIAVIDEGVDLTHEDLIANLVTGYDATGGGSSGGPSGDDAHGTNCAGIAAARSNNTIGVAGVCQNCRIMPVRIAYGDGSGSWITNDSWIANGITWAYQNGASILSNSWGGGTEVTVINTAIANAKSLGRGGKGSVVVFSAGNNDTSSVSYPGYLTNVIAVGASNMCDQRKMPIDNDCNGGEYWWGSNYGSALDISAPGLWLTSTDIMGAAGYNDGNYFQFMNGTSGAAPIVSGVAGLVLSVSPNLTANEVQTILQNTADDVNGGGWDTTMGYGRVNAYRAVQAVYPTNVALSASAVAQGAAAETVVGTLTTTGGIGTITYSLVGDAAGGTGACATGTDNANNASFKIGTGDDANKVLTNAVIATTGSKKICVRATVSDSAYTTQALTISVNAAPTNIVLAPSVVSQGAAAETVVGTITTTGGTGTITYTLVNNTTGGMGTCSAGTDNTDNASFKVGTDANASKILTNATVGTTVDKKICVRATDSSTPAAYYTKAITITVVYSLSGTVTFPACGTLKLGGGLMANFGAKTGMVDFVTGDYTIANVVNGATGTVTITQPSDGYTITNTSGGTIEAPGIVASRTGINFTTVGNRSISGTFTGPVDHGDASRVPDDRAGTASVTLANCVEFHVPTGDQPTTFTISGLPPKAFILTPTYGKGALASNPIGAFSASQYANTIYSNVIGKAFTFTWTPFVIGGSAKNNFGINLTGTSTVTLVGTAPFVGINGTGSAGTTGTWTSSSTFRKPVSGINDPQPYQANITFANTNYQDFVLGTSGIQTFNSTKTNNVTAYGSAAIYGPFGGYTVPAGTVVNFGTGLNSNIEDAGQFLLSNLEPKSYTLVPTAAGIYFTNSATVFAQASQPIPAIAAGTDATGKFYAWSVPKPLTPATTVAFDNAARPTFTWEAASGATDYDLQISTVSTFATTVYSKVRTGNVTSYTIDADIVPNTTYWWRVRATGGTWSNQFPAYARSFMTKYNAPTIGTFVWAGTGTATATLTWTDSVGTLPAGSKYKVEYSKISTFASGVTSAFVAQAVQTYTTTATAANVPTVSYYYRVTLVNAAGTTSLSAASATGTSTTKH